MIGRNLKPVGAPEIFGNRHHQDFDRRIVSKQIELFTAGCGISDRGCAEVSGAGWSPCSELQSILVKPDIFFITLINNFQKKHGVTALDGPLYKTRGLETG